MTPHGVIPNLIGDPNRNKKLSLVLCVIPNTFDFAQCGFRE